MRSLIDLEMHANAIQKDSPLGNLSSRWHKKSFVSSSGTEILVKRDDELGSLCLGSKLRKLASLLDYIKAHKVKHVMARGHARSHFLLALKSLAQEFSFTCEFDLLPERDRKTHPGTDTYRALLGLQHGVSGDPAADHVLCLDEGGFHQSCFYGGVGLAFEVARDMKTERFCDAVYLDAGSGMIALSFAWAWSMLHPEIVCCIVDIGGIERDLVERVATIEKWGEELTGIVASCSFELLTPELAPGFGKVTKASLEILRQVAQETGILLDPIYGVKAWHAMSGDGERKKRKSVLFIHSGGQSTLPGYHHLLLEKP